MLAITNLSAYSYKQEHQTTSGDAKMITFLLCLIAAALAAILVTLHEAEAEPVNQVWKNLHRVTSLG